MKHAIYSLLFAAALCLGMTSCDNDGADLVSPGADTNPAGELEGTYQGTWEYTKAKVGAEDIILDQGTAPGTITATRTTNHTASLQVEAQSTDANFAGCNGNPVAEVTKSNDGTITFQNIIAYNDFAPYISKVTPEKQISFSFTKDMKVGRAQYHFVYSFTGAKAQ